MSNVSLINGHIDEEHTCLNCKHLAINVCYGECSKKFKLVNPWDTCEHWEKE